MKGLRMLEFPSGSRSFFYQFFKSDRCTNWTSSFPLNDVRSCSSPSLNDSSFKPACIKIKSRVYYFAAPSTTTPFNLTLLHRNYRGTIEKQPRGGAFLLSIKWRKMKYWIIKRNFWIPKIMKLAAELCLIGLAVHATDVSGDDNTDNQTVEGSAGELINHYITGIYNLEAIKYAAYYMHELKIFFFVGLLILENLFKKSHFQKLTSYIALMESLSDRLVCFSI